jgi:nucleoside-diphosphate-sugar epimerase
MWIVTALSNVRVCSISRWQPARHRRYRLGCGDTLLSLDRTALWRSYTYSPTLLRIRSLRGTKPAYAHDRCARAARRTTSPGETEHRTRLCYVEDVCEAYILAAAEPYQELGAIYNVGTGVQTSLRQLVETPRRTLPINVEAEWGSMPNRQRDTNTWGADSPKDPARVAVAAS